MMLQFLNKISMYLIGICLVIDDDDDGFRDAPRGFRDRSSDRGMFFFIGVGTL